MRRFTRSRFRRRKARVSWVVAGETYMAKGSAFGATVGPVSHTAFPLVKSGQLAAAAFGVGVASSLLPQECTIQRIRGQLQLHTNDPLDQIRVAIGIGVVDINMVSGVPDDVHPSWTNVPDEECYPWMYLWHGDVGGISNAFVAGTGTQFFTGPRELDIDVTVRRKLRGNQALMLVVANEISRTGNNLVVNPWLRTLISRIV